MRHLVILLTLFPLFDLLVVAPSQEAFGYNIDLFRHSTQGPHNVGRGAGGENDVFALEPGVTNRREAGGGQRRACRVRLATDRFLKAVIEQDGIDVAAHLSGQECERITDFDTESQYESIGEKLILEEQALIESRLVKCNHCRIAIEFAAESESKDTLSLYMIPAGNKINYCRSARTSSLSENILVRGANSPTQTVYLHGLGGACGYCI